MSYLSVELDDSVDARAMTARRGDACAIREAHIKLRRRRPPLKCRFTSDPLLLVDPLPRAPVLGPSVLTRLLLFLLSLKFLHSKDGFQIRQGEVKQPKVADMGQGRNP